MGQGAEHRTPGWPSALAGGLLWMAINYVGDTVDSMGLIGRGMRHVEVDGEVAALLRDAVLAYVLQVGLAHVLMGLVAGVLVHFGLRLWFGGPVRALRWWAVGFGLGLLVTGLGYARQIVSFPTLHDWFWWRREWVDLVTPGQVTLLQLAVAAVLVAWRWAAWGRREPARFGRRLAAFALAVGAVTLTQLRLPVAGPAPDAPAARGGPNIVLIGVDSLRPDHLGSQGNPRPTSPHMDALLAESVRFDSAWTQLARTYPAWVSMLTGTWPTTNGIRDNLPAPHELVPAQATLAQVLQQAGWSTTFVTDDSRFSYMVPELGWDRIHQPPVGLTNFVVASNELRYRTFHAFMHNPLGFAIVPSQRHNQAYGKSYRPTLFEDEVVRQLASAARQERFFLALHSCVLHHPGDRNWPYTRMFGQQGYDGDNRFRYARSASSFEIAGDEDHDDAEAFAEQDARIYDTGVAMADQLVGRVMAALRDGDLLDDTIVVLFSDHGEELWAPDLPYRYSGPNHGFHMLGTAQNRVLLAVRLPGAAGAGTVVTDPVRLLDLGPSLAELVGAPWQGEHEARSLVPLLEGGTDPTPRLVYMETGVSERRYWVPGHRSYPYRRIQERYEIDRETERVFIKEEFRPHLVAAKDRAVQVGRWRLVWHAVQRGTRVGLYDIEADPLHRHDLSRTERERVAWLGSQLGPFLRADGESPDSLALWEEQAVGLDPQAMLAPASAQDQDQDEVAP